MPVSSVSAVSVSSNFPPHLESDPFCTSVDPQTGTAGLLAVAKELGLDMAGVSFHVGSGASNPDALPEGIAAAAAVFARAAQHGFAMRVLDIGGGFPGGEEQAPWPNQFRQTHRQSLQ